MNCWTPPTAPPRTTVEWWRSAISTPDPADAASATGELTVTPQAALALHTALQEGNWNDNLDRAIRISLDTSNRMRLSVSEVWQGDRKVLFDGRVILVAEPEFADALAGRTLAIQTAGGRSSFALRPTPAADS